MKFKALFHQIPRFGFLFSNFFSLGVIKVTDSFILLFLIPIIVHRVGIANYGVVAFVQVIMNYGKNFIDFGFNITGVKAMAIAKSEDKPIGEAFCVIFFTRIFITILFTIALFAFIPIVPNLAEKRSVFFFGIFFLASQILVFDWFFQGIQQSKLLAIANLCSKSLFFLAVLFLVIDPSDYIFILMYQGLAAILIGFGMFLYILKTENISLEVPPWSSIIAVLKRDYSLMLTNMSIEFNSSFSTILLNFFTNNATTGIFNIMYKLVQPLRFLLVIFSQTIYPEICLYSQKGWNNLYPFLKRVYLLFLPFPIVGSIFLIIIASPLLIFFAKEANEFQVWNFRLYLLVPIIILSNIPAYQILLAYDQKEAYSRVYLILFFFKLMLDVILIPYFEITGLIISIILVEGLVSIALYYMVYKYLNLNKL